MKDVIATYIQNGWAAGWESLKDALCHRWIGAGVSFATVSISLLNVETWLRIGSLLVGLAIGIFTLMLQIRKWRNKE